MNEKEEVYSTDEGVISLKSPTKSKILDLLKNEDKSGKEIRKEIDKSKSTISVHLSDLKEMNLIEEKEHPSDKRKKIFSLSSQLVGTSKIPDGEHYREILEGFREVEGRYSFLKKLFHVIRYGLSSFGLDIHPALKEMGRDVGKNLATKFDSNNLSSLLDEIKEFWQRNGLGDVEIKEEKYVIVNECFDCSEMPTIDRALCSLDEGILEAIISEKLNTEVVIQEKECFGLGDDCCRFEISFPEKQITE